MLLSFNVPDDVKAKFDTYIKARNTTQSEFLRLVIYKAIGEPVPPKKASGRKLQSQQS